MKNRLSTVLGRWSAALMLLSGCSSLPFDIPGMSVGGLPVLEEQPDSVLADPVRGEICPVEVAASFDYDDCEICMTMMEDKWWGKSVGVGKVWLRPVVSRQVENTLSGMFHALECSNPPKVVLKFTPQRVSLKKTGEKFASCSVGFSVCAQSGPNELWRGYYEGCANKVWDGVHVPLSVYMAVSQMAEALRQDLDGKQWIPGQGGEQQGGDPPKPLQEPSFLAYEAKPINEAGFVVGSCRLACNDWDSARASEWLRSRLRDRVSAQFGVSKERVRVIYKEEIFDAEKREWQVSFRAFARVAWFFDYKDETGNGICVVDLELAHLTLQNVEDEVVAFVTKEMSRRGVSVVDGKGVEGSHVKYGDFNHDKHFNVVTIRFELEK